MAEGNTEPSEDSAAFWGQMLGSNEHVHDERLLMKSSAKTLTPKIIEEIMHSEPGSGSGPAQRLCLFLIDSLRRRQSFDNFVDMFRDAFEDSSLGNLSTKDLLISVLQSTESKHHPYILWLYAQVRGPLPLFYQVFKPGMGGRPHKISAFSIASMRDVFGTKQHSFLVNIGPSDTCGKSSLLERVIFGDAPVGGLINTVAEGFSHRNSLDLVLSNESPWTIVDAHGWPDDQDFQDAVSTFLQVARVVILHTTVGQCAKAAPILERISKDAKLIVCLRDVAKNEQVEPIASELQIDPKWIIPCVNLSKGGRIMLPVVKSLCLAVGLPDKLRLTTFPDLMKLCNIPQLASYEFEGLSGAGFVMSDSEDRMADEDRKLQSAQLRSAANAEIVSLMKSIEKLKTTNKVRPKRHPIIDEFQKLVVDGNIDAIKEFGFQLGAWKEPRAAPLRAARLELMVQLKENPGDQNVKKQLEICSNKLDDLDLSVDTFWRELICTASIDSAPSRTQSGRKLNLAIVSCFASWVQNANPVQILEGKYLQMHGDFLGKIFGDPGFRNRRLFVISVIGAQSSAKSTLLNYLFGCGFATSAGRCTKGLYASLMENPDLDMTIVVLDSEGLMSVEARDSVFDKQITLMAMACAHVVIVNYKGEINKPIQELLEVCLFALTNLKIAELSPRMLFVQRDMAQTDEATQKKQILDVRGSLELGAEALGIKLNDYLKLDEHSIALMAPAFNSDIRGNIQWSWPNNLFSAHCSLLREKIFTWAKETPSTEGFKSLQSWSTHAQSVWKTISMFGANMLNFSTIREIQNNDQLSNIMHSVWGEFADKFDIQAELMIDKMLKSGADPSSSKKLLDDLERLKMDVQKDLVSAFEAKAQSISAELCPKFVQRLIFKLERGHAEKTARWYLAMEQLNIESTARRVDSQLILKLRESLKSAGGEINESQLVAMLLPEKEKALKTYHSKMLETDSDIGHYVHGLFNSQIDKDPTRVGWVQTFYENQRDENILQVCDRVAQEARNLHNNVLVNMWKGDRVGAVTKLSEGVRKFLAKIDVVPDQQTHRRIKSEEVSSYDKIKSDEVANLLYSIRQFWELTWQPNAERCDIPAVGHKEDKKNFNLLHYEVRDRVVKVELQKRNLRNKQREDEMQQQSKDFAKLVRDLALNQRSDAGRAKILGDLIGAQLTSSISREAASFVETALSTSYVESNFATKTYHNRAFVEGFENADAKAIVAYLKDVEGVMRKMFNHDADNATENFLPEGSVKITKALKSMIKDVADAALKWAPDDSPDGANLETNLVDGVELLEFIGRTGYGNEKGFMAELQSQTIEIANRVTFRIALCSHLNKYSEKVPELAKDALKKAFPEKFNRVWLLVRGCPARCPLCKQKCSNPSDSHTHHDTKHVIMAFGGTGHYQTRTPELNLCTDEKKHHGTWYVGDTKYNNLNECLGKTNRESWVPMPVENAPATTKLRIAWLKTRTAVIEDMEYDLKDNTLDQEPTWRDLVSGGN